MTERELAQLRAINRLVTIIGMNSEDGDQARIDADLVLWTLVEELNPEMFPPGEHKMS